MKPLPGFDASLRILALEAVRGDSNWESQYRRVCRWYSKTFATPLHVVLDLDEVFVLQTYYEEIYAGLDDADWRREARDAIETPAEKAAREAQEAAADAELIKNARADMARLDARRQSGKAMGVDATLQDFENAAEKLKSALDGLPAAIDPQARAGEKVRREKINIPGFAEDGFEVNIGESQVPDDEQMGLKMPPDIVRKRKT